MNGRGSHWPVCFPRILCFRGPLGERWDTPGLHFGDHGSKLIIGTHVTPDRVIIP